MVDQHQRQERWLDWAMDEGLPDRWSDSVKKMNDEWWCKHAVDLIERGRFRAAAVVCLGLLGIEKKKRAS